MITTRKGYWRPHVRWRGGRRGEPGAYQICVGPSMGTEQCALSRAEMPPLSRVRAEYGCMLRVVLINDHARGVREA